MLKFFSNGVWKATLLLSLQVVGWGHAESSNKTRRDLAEMLIKKNYLSQPQNHNCTQVINVPFIEYQTVAVDTKNLRLLSQIRATLMWMDPDLSWDYNDYPYTQVILPVSKVWTPEIQVTNGIVTTMKHSSSDLLVYVNGTVRHSVIIKAEVNCEVNLFNYPFAADECPVAIQSWAAGDCGTAMLFGDELQLVDGTHGDWQTEYIYLEQQQNRLDRNYIRVGLKVKYTNPFITLMLPSLLLLLADVVSFALPLAGGERNCFKVTLVLSFTMFLIILNDVLPGDSQCSPIIRTHFCICLVLLVFSMLVSMVLTGLANNGSLIFSWRSKKDRKQENTENKEENGDEEAKVDISVVQLNAEGDSKMLRKIVDFLEDQNSKNSKSEKYKSAAETVDKIFFWCYLVLSISYFIAMNCVMVWYTCTVNHFDFWY